ncbi:hypothetical protein Q3G72_009344 [Acer saccharum]|nr:hypothetical protein Q3G72_009344 [Acer saccharum]
MARSSSTATESTQDASEYGGWSNLFEDYLKELRRWASTKSSKYKRLETALKVLNDMIQDDTESPKKKIYEQKISLIDEMGWSPLTTHE